MMKRRLNNLLITGMLAVLVQAGCSGGRGPAGAAGKDLLSTDVGEWGVAELIETNVITSTGFPCFPQVAFDRNGDAIAVWYQTDGTRFNIWANRYTAGTGWGTAGLIETDNTEDAVYPQIAFDTIGNAIAVWYQSDGTRYNIWSNRYTAGTGWGTAGLIETDNAGNANQPQIAFDRNGNAIAVWYQTDGTRYNIWANRYTAGTGWGTAGLIETDNAGNAAYPRIAIDPNGNAIAVWNQYDGTRWNIWANRYAAGTGWGTAGLIETDNAGDAYYPKIAFDSNGNAIAVWNQSDGTRYNIWANRYVAGTGWGTAGLIEINNAGDSFESQIAFDSKGNAIAVWRKNDGTRYNIWSNRYVAGTGWGTAGLIEINNAGNALYPQIAFDANGNAVAVWQQYDGMRDNIWANRYTAGTGWGRGELIEYDSTGNATNPQIAFDPNGNAIAVWHQFDGTRDHIWANRFE